MVPNVIDEPHGQEARLVLLGAQGVTPGRVGSSAWLGCALLTLKTESIICVKNADYEYQGQTASPGNERETSAIDAIIGCISCVPKCRVCDLDQGSVAERSYPAEEYW